MAFKILSKKNGKRTISDDKGNDTIKVTKVLQFLTEVDPKKATIGTIVWHKNHINKYERR